MVLTSLGMGGGKRETEMLKDRSFFSPEEGKERERKEGRKNTPLQFWNGPYWPETSVDLAYGLVLSSRPSSSCSSDADADYFCRGMTAADLAVNQGPTSMTSWTAKEVSRVESIRAQPHRGARRPRRLPAINMALKYHTYDEFLNPNKAWVLQTQPPELVSLPRCSVSHAPIPCSLASWLMACACRPLCACVTVIPPITSSRRLNPRATETRIHYDGAPHWLSRQSRTPRHQTERTSGICCR